VLIPKEQENLAFGTFMFVYRSPFNRFLFQWFNTQQFKKIIHKNLGVVINSINGKDLKFLSPHFPSNKK